MCWNAEVSISAFVVGSVINSVILYVAVRQQKQATQDKKQLLSALATLCIGWYWVIGMQLWEYLVWTFPDNNFYAKMAFVFNITQILVLYLLFINGNVENYNKIIASIALLLYICVMLYPYKNQKITVNSCERLQYSWWDSNWKAAAYMLSLITIFLCLVRPIQWSASTLAVIILFLIFSMIFYKKYVPSMWCFFAVSVPVFAYLLSFLWK